MAIASTRRYGSSRSMVVSFFSPLTLVETSIGHMRFSALSFSGTSSVGIAEPFIVRLSGIPPNGLIDGPYTGSASFQGMKSQGLVGRTILEVQHDGSQLVAKGCQPV